MASAPSAMPFSPPAIRGARPQLTIHREAESSFGLILGETEIIQHPGCMEYRARVIQTLNEQPFNIIDSIHVTVTPKATYYKACGTRLFAKAFINHADVPNSHAFFEGRCDIECEVANHMEQIRENMERAMSPVE